MITLNVNGKPMSVDADRDTPLLWVLRDHLGMTGTKYGCGMALCGACTVHVNGQPARSCSTAGTRGSTGSTASSRPIASATRSTSTASLDQTLFSGSAGWSSIGSPGSDLNVPP